MPEQRNERPCAWCLGRGWHVGECHPREVCGGCDGSGTVTATSIEEASAALAILVSKACVGENDPRALAVRAYLRDSVERSERLTRYARTELERFIADYSEETYSAGWLHGIEHVLWKLVVSTELVLEHDVKTAEVLRQLAADAGGWVMWSDTEGGPVFVPITEWKAIHARGVQP